MWQNWIIKWILSPLSNSVAKLVCPIWLTNYVPDLNGLNEILPFCNNFPFLQFCFYVNSTTKQIWEWKHSQTIADGWNWHSTTEIEKKYEVYIFYVEIEKNYKDLLGIYLQMVMRGQKSVQIVNAIAIQTQSF